ncbi:MAG: C69 family dipeptidase [bacterium]
MCDTQVIRKDGVTLFAKNSDREPNEAQLVVRVPPMVGDKSPKLKTTYLEIDQVPNRHGTILSKPFWIWGAEIGANDQGVVIGNEAVFTKVQEKTDGLIGMDLLRLGLERGDTAEEALHVITRLLQQHGQGGICGYRDKTLRYDNSFIIADPGEAWILETAARHWVAKRVASQGAISNCLTISHDFDLQSEGLENFARERGLFDGKGDFCFNRTFDTWFLPYFSGSHKRLACSVANLNGISRQPTATAGDMMNSLRSHQSRSLHHTRRKNSDVCMHAAGYIRRSQTTGSMVSQLDASGSYHFFTGSSAPCLSLFKPVNVYPSQDFSVLNRDETSWEDSPWLAHEHIHRHLLLDPQHHAEFTASRDKAEREMLATLLNNRLAPSAEDYRVADRIVADWEQHWMERYRKEPFNYAAFSPYSLYWKRFNRMLGLEG